MASRKPFGMYSKNHLVCIAETIQYVLTIHTNMFSETYQYI